MKSMSYNTDIGYITLTEDDGFLTELSFRKLENGEETLFLRECFKEIKEYLAGERREFDIPLRPKGTEFQKKVWDALLKIPYGEVRSYGETAKIAGCEKACRAVGGACNKNKIAIIIPCHRVIGKDGSLTGFGGGLWIKEKLLYLEGRGGR